MENEFVTYEEALALKELCFDDMCFCYFDNEKELRTCIGLKNWNSHYGFPLFVSAPLKQQVFRWFRERYGISHSIYMYNNKIVANVSGNNYGSLIYEIASYEEAENACIDKLIEVAKQQSNG